MGVEAWDKPRRSQVQAALWFGRGCVEADIPAPIQFYRRRINPSKTNSPFFSGRGLPVLWPTSSKIHGPPSTACRRSLRDSITSHPLNNTSFLRSVVSSLVLLTSFAITIHRIHTPVFAPNRREQYSLSFLFSSHSRLVITSCKHSKWLTCK